MSGNFDSTTEKEDSLSKPVSCLTTVVHPRIRKQNKNSTIAFSEDWDRYIDQVRDAGREPVRIKSAIDSDVLRALLFTKALGPDITKSENVTDQHITAYIEKVRNRGNQVFNIPSLEKMLKSLLHMNMLEDDVTCRIQTFFGDFINFIT